MFSSSARWGFVLAVAVCLFWSPASDACPFCSAVSMTLSEEIGAADVAVLAKLADAPAEEAAPDDSAQQPVKVKFDIVDVLKGADIVGDTKQIEVLYFGQDEQKAEFLITGIDPQQLSWATPIGLSERAAEYVRKLDELPEAGADRLAYFQDYFEDEDPLLAGDAYDEFAKAPYADVKDLEDRMQREKLLAWIQDPNVTASRRRLYLTMLGVCGKQDDLPVLETMIRSDDRQLKTALDAIVACYLTLKGPDGLPLIEDSFLKNQDAEYTDTYAAIMALRFHGQEEDIIPKERIVQALGHMLDRPQLADLVIPDLARWEDWSVMDRLVELFKNADEESAWVRVPVVNYLRACPLPEAKERMAELEAIDPDAVKRANSFFPLATAPVAEADGEPAVDPPVPPPAAPANDVAASSVSNGESTESDETMAESPAEPTDESVAETELVEEVATSDEQPNSEDDLAAATPVDTSGGGGGNPGGLSGTSYLLVVTLVPLAICLVLLAVLRIILRRPRRVTT